MSWFFKKPKKEYILVITRYSEALPLKIEVEQCIDFKSLVNAKGVLRYKIRNMVINYLKRGIDADEFIKRENSLVNSIYFESHNELLHGENALDAISETIIPSSTFTSVKEMEQYYENFTCVQLSFFLLDESMLRTVFGVFIREK